VCARGCANRGRSRLVAQQGDLAEALAASERPDDASVADHLGATGLDDVEALATLALLEHSLPRRELGRLEPGAPRLSQSASPRAPPLRGDFAWHGEANVARTSRGAWFLMRGVASSWMYAETTASATTRAR